MRSRRMATPPRNSTHVLGLIVRLVLPCAILAGGWFGFTYLSSGVEKAPTPEKERQTLRTKVQKLEVADYPVIVKTHAVVQAHNDVTLASQVAGRVVRVSPSFEVGAYFTEGEVLVEIDPRDFENQLAIAKSELAVAESTLTLAKLVEDRKLRLVKSKAVSQGEVDSATASREQAEANVNLAESRVEQAKLDLQRTKVLAPFDGRVKSKLIGIGQMAGTNNPLGEVFAIDYVEVRLPIAGDQRQFLNLPEFSEDASLEVTLQDAIRDANDTVWRGKIVRTEGVLDADSRDLFAIARIDDPFGRKTNKPPLRVGQPVIASIEGTTLKNVVALPRAAVRQMDRVVLVDPTDQTLRPMTVEALWSDAENVVVPASAIPSNMWLATTTLAYYPEGAKVEIIPEPGAGESIAESTSADAPTKATN
ncbi:efflux RND transporter periplasmic adaptor subunit [Aeoliella sp. ICT_H6.2]|uniref:Efflux RND transporter periplasmic adaptor subunit n=1 Tax=Aeoliella straminimaris TaxID=2954799 RepID=A0A9X2JH57_9BACT|nr:efflux RND transporter periplasmic adaptor subunit [Aeoliella straminimaris]MCO6044293.1 efflux RND transporter periplasmic adaptor subunit [Aeoliella straminimaris]